MKKLTLYNKYRHQTFEEQEYSMPVISRFGTGGGNMPIVLESNQNHATAKETETCNSLPASMGMGGGYVPAVVEPLPFDTTQITSPGNYSHPKPNDPCHPLAATAHIPAIAIGNGQTNNIAMSETANNLDCMHDQQAVLEYEGGGDAMKSVVRRITPLE